MLNLSLTLEMILDLTPINSIQALPLTGQSPAGNAHDSPIARQAPTDEIPRMHAQK